MFKVVLPALVSLNLAQAQLFGPQPSRPTFSRNNDQIVDQVLDQLSPSIAQAVAEALRGLNDNRQASGPPSPPRPVESKASPAQYKFEYKIANDRTQTYIFQEESRDGLEVVGSYGYVDPTGALITVRYTAGVDGYQETRERQEGAVQIAPSPVRDAAPQPARGSLDSAAIIRQVLAALQPAIRESVQSAISG